MKGACVQSVLISPPLVAQSSAFQRLEYILIGWFFGNGTPFDSKFLNSLMGVPFTEKLRWKSKKSIKSVYGKIWNKVHKWEIGGMLTWCVGDSKVWNRCENLQLSQTIARKYGRGWEGAALEFDASRRGCSRVGAASELFFFFFSFGFAPTRLRFAPNRADSARIELYRPYRVVSAGDRNGRNRWNRLKSALNHKVKVYRSCPFLFFCWVKGHFYVNK